MNEQIKQHIEQLNNGEVPKGYKKTEIGVFPSDWVTDKTLGDLFDFYGGLSKSRDELGEEGYAYLHYGDLHRGTFNTVSFDQYEQLPKCDISLNGKEKCLMKDGDVAFLDASEDIEGTSRAVLIDNPENRPFIAGLHIIYGKAKNNSLDKWFKQYITSSESVKKQFQRLAVGFKVYGVNRDTIPRIKVAFPSSKKEQSQIAKILMKWDEAIELYDKQIEALTRYKAVCLNKMFPSKGQKVPEWRFQGFSGDWEQHKFGDDLISIQTGTNKLSSDQGKGMPLLKMGNIQRGYFSLDKLDYLPESEQVEPEKIANYGDFFFNTRNTLELVGKGATWTGNSGEYAFNSNIARLNLKDIDTIFFSYLYNTASMINQVHARAMGTTSVAAIYPQSLNSIDYHVPSMDEQRAIGGFLLKTDDLITLHQRKKMTIINQRKALQQYLLNGIVRVEHD